MSLTETQEKPAGNRQAQRFVSGNNINLDIGFRCTLECPGCSRQRAFKGIRPIPGHDMTVDEYRKIIGHFSQITMCGQISDPIFNPNLLEFIKMSKEADVTLYIHSAASQKPMRWYEEAFDSFGKGSWTFGIDGLPKDSHLYRINQDGEKLFEVAKLCASKGIKTNWQYIVFRYNENNIEEARQMALDNNINFSIMKSSRFGTAEDQEKYKPLNPEYYIDRST